MTGPPFAALTVHAGSYHSGADESFRSRKYCVASPADVV